MITLYRLTTHLAGPLVRALLRRRGKAGKEDPARLGERLGQAALPRPAGALVWLHAASVGEAVSALPLIERLRAGTEAPTVLMTTGTVTSATLMAERLPDGALHQYVPVDLPRAVTLFLDHWRPDLVLWLESELWPNLLSEIGQRAIPALLLNARMSAQSYRRWQRWPASARALLKVFGKVMAQSEADAKRMRHLGASVMNAIGNLKAAAAALPVEPAALEALREAVGGRPCWLAASTHDGEEAMAGEVHRRLSEAHGDLLTIIVPRHPERGDEIAGRLGAEGFRLAQRSRGAEPGAATEIYLCDTLGELGLFYRFCDIVFIGGSLVPAGGHNPFEPARLNCALLSGPEQFNFAEAMAALSACKGLLTVADSAALAAAVDTLLRDPAARQALVRAAVQHVDDGLDQEQILGHVMAAIERLNPGLTGPTDGLELEAHAGA